MGELAAGAVEGRLYTVSLRVDMVCSYLLITTTLVNVHLTCDSQFKYIFLPKSNPREVL